MKKLLSVLVIVILCFSLFACSQADKTKVTVTPINGNSETMTVSEFKEAGKNELKYQGAEITFVGTVKEIQTNIYENGSSIKTDYITFEENIQVYLLSGYNTDFLSSIDIGDKVEVTSNLFSADGYYIDVRGMSSKEGYNEESLKKTTLSHAY